ncbi:beta-1,6-N-acetylglucosaminyltransferase [Demequina iriomotensis]|uniref:beta-1,6-N-acetylglucosaminyltransferase n=1 Tax=Demequina iriomotensis TaxID=1536641 RepID=UPI00078126BF|nr:beta-1,6-N-acetylglucosaminyltransferase [Demequina iriomotensis]
MSAQERDQGCRVAYLIQVHQQTPHLDVLVDTLLEACAGIWIHVDAKADLSEFRDYTDEPRVHYCATRFSVSWGGFSLSRATLALMAEALSAGVDRLVVLSGACFPLRSPEEIVEAFAARPTTQFIDLHPMPAPEEGKPIERLSEYHFREVPAVGSDLWRKVLRRVHRLHLPRPGYRRLLGGRTPFGGATWWALTADAARAVVETGRDDRALTRLYRHAFGPDESYFQTIIGNSPFAADAEPSLTFAYWSRGNGLSPANIDDDLIDELVRARSGAATDPAMARALFVRKLPPESAELRARIVTEVWPASSDAAGRATQGSARR